MIDYIYGVLCARQFYAFYMCNTFHQVQLQLLLSFLSFFLFLFFWFLVLHLWHMEVLRGQIRATATGLHHSHSNLGSEPSLQPAPQLTAMPDP